MNPENCVVIGPAVMRYDSARLLEFCDVIVAGNIHKNNEFPYATVNSETRLQDMLNSASFRETIILTPDKLYKKYVFFEQIDALPSLPEVNSTGKKMEELSEQSLALMLAMWMEKKHIYLFGYDIQDLEERSVLLGILGANPFCNVYYVRKPNPAKIHLFDTYENTQVIDFTEFDRIRDAG
jgi:hypothetical protein